MAVPLVLGGTGTAYSVHYQERALPGSSVGGLSVAGMTRAEVAQAVRERTDATTVTLRAGAGSRTARLADLGWTVDVDATTDALLADRSWSSYATSLVSSRDVDAVVRIDPARTAAVVTELVKAAGEVGTDASVRLAPGKASFAV
ncbi:MAG: hypothetical protein ACRCYR_03475, partial [Phycicoccus sp.]